MTKILILHDCAGVMLHLKDKLIEHGFEVEYYYFRVEDEPYLDYGLHVKKLSKLQVSKFVLKKALLAKYDIFHTYNTRFPNHPLPYEYMIAKMRKKKVVVHFHGSDLRLGYNKISRKILLKNKTLLVSTPDLLQFCPNHAIWLPNPVDSQMFTPIPSQTHDGLRILHSSTDPEIKGTKYLVDAVEKLQSEGCKIELHIVGRSYPVPHSAMPKLFHWCDIVVNEILLPAYSIVRIEAMMCNKLVLSHFETPAFIMKIPITCIDKNNIQERLRYFYENPEEIGKMARGGREWAMQYHSLDKVVEKLIKIYESA